MRLIKTRQHSRSLHIHHGRVRASQLQELLNRAYGSDSVSRHRHRSGNGIPLIECDNNSVHQQQIRI
ncbi:hypothetical protein D3C81_2087290 [compost metagenome]